MNISGPRIKERRKELEWVQEDLVAAMKVDYKIKIDRSDISEIERGVRGVKDYELKAIAEILNVEVDWLLGY